MHSGKMQVCVLSVFVILCPCRNGVEGQERSDAGRQRDALPRSHHVRRGCGNAVLGNMHVTCVPGRWFATHRQPVPVSSTRHQSRATPISFQRRGVHSGHSHYKCMSFTKSTIFSELFPIRPCKISHTLQFVCLFEMCSLNLWWVRFFSVSCVAPFLVKS